MSQQGKQTLMLSADERSSSPKQSLLAAAGNCNPATPPPSMTQQQALNHWHHDQGVAGVIEHMASTTPDRAEKKKAEEVKHSDTEDNNDEEEEKYSDVDEESSLATEDEWFHHSDFRRPDNHHAFLYVAYCVRNIKCDLKRAIKEMLVELMDLSNGSLARPPWSVIGPVLALSVTSKFRPVDAVNALEKLSKSEMQLSMIHACLFQARLLDEVCNLVERETPGALKLALLLCTGNKA